MQKHTPKNNVKRPMVKKAKGKTKQIKVWSL